MRRKILPFNWKGVDNMSKLNEVLKQIEELKELMYQIMEESEELTDAEIVKVSQELDKLLNEYGKLINKK